jgi:hypothetical protein
MVAGRCFWGQDEQHSGQHQPGRAGELAVEAAVEDPGGAGELRGLLAGVEARRQVDDEDHGEAEQAEQEDRPAEAAAVAADAEERKPGG